jgi:hypothetical protein
MDIIDKANCIVCFISIECLNNGSNDLECADNPRNKGINVKSASHFTGSICMTYRYHSLA